MFQNRDAVVKKRFLNVLVGVVLFAVILLVVLLAILVPKHKTKPDSTARIECPGFTNKSECESHGCTYQSVQRGPFCYMKQDSFGYLMLDSKNYPTGKVASLKSRTEKTPYGPSIVSVLFTVTYVTENIVRVNIKDETTERYEVPAQKEFPLLQQPRNVDAKNLAYDVSLSNDSGLFTFQMRRKSGDVLWDTSIGGLMLSDQYLQIASYLPSRNIYGLGEHTHNSLRHDLDYKTWPIFARDQFPIGGEINLYGVHPFYTCLENSTKSHGVLLLNSNAMEVTLMPDPAISFRTIGGVLDMFFFVGDSPEHVIQLYTTLVGRPMMPPYWGLGFQLSRYEYNNLQNVKNAVERTRNASIAQDVQFLDIDHMDENRDFTYDKKRFAGLIEYIKETKETYGLKWIIIIDPAIAADKKYDPYANGLKQDVFIKRSPSWEPDMFPPEVQDVNITFGKVWPVPVVAFPDYLNPKAQDWWTNALVEYHKVLPFDGLWTDMNEPSNFETNEDTPPDCNPKEKLCWSLKCPESPYEYPPYNPLKKSGSDRLSKMTLCMDSLQTDDSGKNYRHYDVHSLYGWSQSVSTIKAAEIATGTRSLVISRSTFTSSGRYAGHWLGDNRSSWDDLRHSIIGMLEFNMFGIPYIGADVCGFFLNTTVELCTRWMQMGAFYPFFRNHNGAGEREQDPAVLGEEVTRASQLAVERRYNLNPYLYTLFYRSHLDGSTVVRPLFHEFPSDANTWNIGEQFMWGSCLLISPVVHEGQKSVNLYLPKEDWWYFKYNESESEKMDTNPAGYVEKAIPDRIPLHVRGGCIIPTEQYELKRLKKRGSGIISLYIFLKNNQSSGELFIDDGVSKDTVEQKSYILYKFQMKNCELTVEVEKGTKFAGDPPFLDRIYAFGTKIDESGSVKQVRASEDIKMKLPAEGVENLWKGNGTFC